MMYDERKKYYEKIAQKESSGVDPQFTESWINGFIEGCIYKDFHQNCVTCFNHSSNTKLMQAKTIIKEWLDYYHEKFYPYAMLEILSKAEEFVKE